MPLPPPLRCHETREAAVHHEARPPCPPLPPPPVAKLGLGLDDPEFWENMGWTKFRKKNFKKVLPIYASYILCCVFICPLSMNAINNAVMHLM